MLGSFLIPNVVPVLSEVEGKDRCPHQDLAVIPSAAGNIESPNAQAMLRDAKRIRGCRETHMMCARVSLWRSLAALGMTGIATRLTDPSFAFAPFTALRATHDTRGKRDTFAMMTGRRATDVR